MKDEVRGTGHGQMTPVGTAGRSQMGDTGDSVREIRLSRVRVPLDAPVSDAKVSAGRQKPLTEVSVLVAEISSRQGHTGVGFGYALRVGGRAQYVHALELADSVVGEDPNDIAKLNETLLWAGASVGRSGVALQAIAAIDTALWDMKARRARLPLARLIGAYRSSVPVYNTSGGYLSSSVAEIKENANRSLARGIGGVKIKMGLPDRTEDLRRLAAVREHLGPDVPLMVDVNQQWDRTVALRMGRSLEEFGLTWIEEPLDAHDFDGYAALTAAVDTPISTGEMLSSVAELRQHIAARSCDVLQPDAPRVGGITNFLQLATFAHDAGLDMAPHFVMELHIHLAACYPGQTWVEHFDWLEPLFEERLEIRDGQMLVPDRPGLGLTLSGQARQWTVETAVVRHA